MIRTGSKRNGLHSLCVVSGDWSKLMHGMKKIALSSAIFNLQRACLDVVHAG